MTDLFLRTEAARLANQYACRRHEMQARASARLVPTVPQKPLDIGLFGDDAAQSDLTDMERRK
jgi:hypothetical protein